MKKRLASGYTFTAAAKTIVHADFSDITLEGIQLIINVTDQIIIYNFADTTKGGTLSTDTLTLEYDTTSMSDTDKLMILVEDGSAIQPVSFTGSTDAATQTTLAAINTKLVTGTDIGDVTINNAAGAAAVNIQDGGNTITVDGTVAVTNADITSIKTAVEIIDNAVSGTGFNVSQLGGAAVPIGAGLEATAVRVTLPTDGTGVVKLGAGTAEIGKLAAGTANIGDVDVASIAAGDNNIGNVDIVTVPADPFGVNADAASVSTSISAKLKGIATALGITALDLGTGTGGTRTLRSFQDTAQWVGGTGVDSTAVQRISLATNVALPAGTNAIGKLAANSGVDIGDVDVTSIAAGTNSIGNVGVIPRTSGGLLIKNCTSGDGSTALTSTAQAIKASAGQLFGWYIFNPNTVTAWVIIYNTAAASVTVGTTAPVLVIGVPAGAAANVVNPMGIEFTNAGWSAAAVMTSAGGTTAPTTALDVNFFYI